MTRLLYFLALARSCRRRPHPVNRGVHSFPGLAGHRGPAIIAVDRATCTVQPGRRYNTGPAAGRLQHFCLFSDRCVIRAAVITCETYVRRQFAVNSMQKRNPVVLVRLHAAMLRKKRFVSAATEKPGGRTGRLAARWLVRGEGPWPTEMCGRRTRPLGRRSTEPPTASR